MIRPTYYDDETSELPPKRRLTSAKSGRLHRQALTIVAEAIDLEGINLPDLSPTNDRSRSNTIGKRYDENKYMANFMAEDKPHELEERVVETISPFGKSSYKVVVKHRGKLQTKTTPIGTWRRLRDSQRQG